MADRIRLRVITSNGDGVEKMVNYVSLPTQFGSVGVLSGHAPMLCAVKSGVIKYRMGEDTVFHLSVSDGIANVADNEVTVLVSYLEEIV